MTIDDYFSNRLYKKPNFGAEGIESEWLHFCDFPLRGTRFSISDTEFVCSEPDSLIIDAAPGVYEINVRALDYEGGDQRISRLRVVEKCSKPRIGRKIGETWTDTSRTGVCDLDIFKRNWGDDAEYLEKYIRPAAQAEQRYGIVIVNESAGAIMPFVDSGFGDGRFPVFELLDNAMRVGFEIEFISADESYPF